MGRTYIQPDSNLRAAETLCRHFEKGLAWFEKEIGTRPRISWQADSFRTHCGLAEYFAQFRDGSQIHH